VHLCLCNKLLQKKYIPFFLRKKYYLVLTKAEKSNNIHQWMVRSWPWQGAMETVRAPLMDMPQFDSFAS
jgi:hypothetical protein